jgi:hypothetical protein
VRLARLDLVRHRIAVLADEHEIGGVVPHPEDDLRASLRQAAPRAASDLRGELL